MRLCLVTDRHRLLKTLRRSESEWRSVLLEQLRGAVAAGVDLIQIRERDLDARSLCGLVRDALALADDTKTQIVVNDRVDVAIAANAAGVHLREDSMPAAAVRRLCGGRFLVGRSVHAIEGVWSAGDADYLMAGPAFATASKPGAPDVLGADGLERLLKAAGATPSWAIGGITRQTAVSLSGLPLVGLAAIGAFMPAGPTEKIASEVVESVENLRFAFDSTSTFS